MSIQKRRKDILDFINDFKNDCDRLGTTSGNTT